MATTFPEQIQTFITKVDITTADASKVKQYQQYVQDGNFTQAQVVLQTISNYQSKILTTEEINTLQDTCVALERYYLERYSSAYVVQDTEPLTQRNGDYWFDLD